MFLFQALTVILLGSCLSYADSDEERFLEDNGLENPDLFEGDIIDLEDQDDRNAVPKAERLWPGGIIPYVVDAGLSSTIQRFLEDNGLENPDLFEGDIIDLEDQDDRNAVPKAERLWPGGIIPYVVDAGLSSTIRLEMLARAMWRYGNKTCIRFVPRTTETNYVRIFPGQGCYSTIGKSKSKTIQVVSLGRGCGFMGTILHELGHTVGFFHEHSRSDRDDWITIIWDNIKNGQESQFKKLKPAENILLTPFDFNSIMLYGSYTFSKDKKNLKTMVRKDGSILQSTRERLNLSASDSIRIRKLYQCEK